MKKRERMKGLRALAFVAVSTAACQGDREEEPVPRGASERDSAGIRIIENARPSEGSRLEWRIGPRPAVSIGEIEGEDPYIFHRALDATRLPDGRIVVAHRSSGELRVFDASGTHLASWGGEGEAPGEFHGGSLAAVEPWHGDSVMAWYAGFAGVISVFDDDGNFGRSFRLGGMPPDTRWPVAPRADGTIVVTVNAEQLHSGIEIWNGDGTRSADLGTYPVFETYQAFFELEQEFHPYPVVYSRTLELGPWGDLVFVCLSNRFEFKAFRADGTLARIVRLDHDPRPTTQADHDRYVEQEVAILRRRNPPVSAERLKRERETAESREMAKTFPAFSEVMGDGAGYLWVREYDLPGEERPVPLWLVFDPGGRALGFVETPAGLQVREIGEDYILGRRVDELGVESIQLWPLERPGT